MFLVLTTNLLRKKVSRFIYRNEWAIHCFLLSVQRKANATFLGKWGKMFGGFFLKLDFRQEILDGKGCCHSKQKTPESPTDVSRSTKFPQREREKNGRHGKETKKKTFTDCDFRLNFFLCSFLFYLFIFL